MESPLTVVFSLRFSFFLLRSFSCHYQTSYFIFLLMQSLARMNKKDSWLFWWTLYLTVSLLVNNSLRISIFTSHLWSWNVPFQAALWIMLGIFSLIRLQADYLLVVGVCLTLSIANIIGFTKCRKGKLLWINTCLINFLGEIMLLFFDPFGLNFSSK